MPMTALLSVDFPPFTTAEGVGVWCTGSEDSLTRVPSNLRVTRAPYVWGLGFMV